MKTKPSSPPEAVWEAVEAVQEKKALDVVLLNLEEAAVFTDYFLICSGSSSRQVQAISDEVEIRLFVSARILNYDKVSGGPTAFDTPLWKTYAETGFDAMAAQYKELSAAPLEKPEDAQRREAAVNRLGYKLLWGNKTKEAITVFEWNASAFPKSANVYNSLADAQARADEREKALASYKKSLEMDAENPNATLMIRYLSENAKP